MNTDMCFTWGEAL